MLLFVFLKRDKAKDLQRVREISDYLVRLNLPTTLLIFPEGTDLSPSNHQKSLAFARKEGLAEYLYVLHPKVRQLQYMTCAAFTFALGSTFLKEGTSVLHPRPATPL